MTKFHVLRKKLGTVQTCAYYIANPVISEIKKIMIKTEPILAIRGVDAAENAPPKYLSVNTTRKILFHPYPHQKGTSC